VHQRLLEESFLKLLARASPEQRWHQLDRATRESWARTTE